MNLQLKLGFSLFFIITVLLLLFYMYVALRQFQLHVDPDLEKEAGQ